MASISSPFLLGFALCAGAAAIGPGHASAAAATGSVSAKKALAFALEARPYVLTPAKVALGEKLFFDTRLSSDKTVSCATCHEPSKGFVDHLPTSEGVGRQRGQRNAPTILNAMLQESQFWDGRAKTLEQQATLPMLNPIEMGQPNEQAVVAVVRADPDLLAAFRAVYGDVSFQAIADAITAYEHTQLALDAPFDHFLAGDKSKLSPAAQRGWALFNGEARCTDCHAANVLNPLFSDQKFHNIGIAANRSDFSALAHQAAGEVDHHNEKNIDEMALQSEYSELGRFLVSKQRHDIGAFKTQTLRNIGITPPYMHDGSLPTLWDVVDHYNRGGIANPYLDGGMQALGLDEKEIDDLVAFLFSLTDERYAALNQQQLRAQTAQKKRSRPRRDTAAAMGKKGDLGDIGQTSSDKDMGHAGIY